MKERNSAEQNNPGEYTEDPLTEVLRKGARDLLTQAVEAEVQGVLAAHAEIRDEEGHQMIVLNGHLPERTIQTGIGAVRGRRVRDQRTIPKADRIQFTSKILPRYLRRTKSLEELIPWLYLKGISTGDFSEALRALVGSPAGLSPATGVSAEGRMATGVGDLAEARPNRQAVCLLLGGWPACECADGGRPLSLGRDWGHGRRPQRAGGRGGWGPGERTILDRPPPHSQKSWVGGGTGTRHWRRGLGILKGRDASLWDHPVATVLGT